MNTYIYNKVKKQIGIVGVVAAWLLLLVMAMLPVPASAEGEGKYDDAHPLIIVGCSDFPPYHFLSTSNQPTGHDVEIIDAILSHMNIPHKFVLTNWEEATAMFEQREVHLIFDLMGKYNHAPYHYSRNPLSYFKYVVATRTNVKMATIEQLKSSNNIVIESNDEATDSILRKMAPGLRFRKEQAKDAIISLYTNACDFFIYDEETIKWKLKELRLTSDITMNNIGIPVREMCLAGYDKELIDQIDDQLTRFQQNGRVEMIHDKWMHPERSHNNVPLIVIYITVGILLLALALISANRLSKRRLLAVTGKATDAERMMRQALSMGNIWVFSHDTATNKFKNLNGNFFPSEGYTWKQFVERLHPDERERTEQAMKKLLNGSIGIWEITNRWNIGTLEQPDWMFIHGYSIAEQDEDGHTRYVISAVRNVTKDYEEERADNEMATKYVKMFNSTLIAMSFYDKDGKLIDLNENMRTLCEFETIGEQFFRETNLFDNPFFRKDLKPLSHEDFHVCQHMSYPEIGISKYLEVRVLPTYDNDELQYYIVTARDVSAERDMYMKQEQQNKELHHTNETITRYERELRYLLENCNMWVWRSSLKDKRIYLSRSLQKDEYCQTFEEYLGNIDERYLPEAMQAYGNMNGTTAQINIVLLFKHTPVNPNPHWCASNGIPVYDADGTLAGHFGIVRDVTDLMEVQERLKQEKKRAEDSGKLKSVFLANMTHEIRTPLNAIVGFSDLLQMIDSSEERSEFIRIIRNNCDMLMRLINDIIEASSMDQGTLTIETEKVDFAAAFNDICQTLAQRVEEPGVEFLTDNPYESFVTVIDKGRLQQVITNFTTNAVKYTHQGHIKVGYRYIQAPRHSSVGNVMEHSSGEEGGPYGLYLYCEDTGAGIPKDKQSSVFERFVKLNDYVQGTGLGLSICKSIAERCHGQIGVMSEGDGHGSTFWIWIPCEHLQ